MLNLYFVMGPTGSGKSTVLNKLFIKIPEMRKITQYTTRPKRDENDNDYIFVSNETYNMAFNHLSTKSNTLDAIKDNENLEHKKILEDMLNSYVLSNRAYEVTDSVLWQYAMVLDEDIFDMQYSNANYATSCTVKQLFDIIGNLICTYDERLVDLVHNGSNLSLNFIIIETDNGKRLKYLYEREEERDQIPYEVNNYRELLRRYISDTYENNFNEQLMSGLLTALLNDLIHNSGVKVNVDIITNNYDDNFYEDINKYISKIPSCSIADDFSINNDTER